MRTNLDLFLEHGSTPEGPNPKETMPAWGDTKKLTPQQIADVIAYVMSLNPAPTATTPVTPTAEVTPTVDVARPSNPGDAGPALHLTGDVTAGADGLHGELQEVSRRSRCGRRGESRLDGWHDSAVESHR